MLKHFVTLSDIGPFAALDQHADFAPCSLIFAANGLGKSTLAAVLGAAAAGDDAAVQTRARLGATAPPVVRLAHSAGERIFDGTWSGPTPSVRVFDQAFVERNVYAGRAMSKDQREGLLELAVGDETEPKRQLDELATRQRKLTSERKALAAELDQIAREVGAFGHEDLLAMPVEQLDPSVLQTAQRDLDAARLGAEIARRPRYQPLPAPPTVDPERWRSVLSADVQGVSDAAERAVRAHVDAHLKSGGETWLRQGLEHASGEACPFCAQPTDGLDLLGAFRAYFDDAYGRHLDELQRTEASLEDLTSWWHELKRVGVSNKRDVEPLWREETGDGPVLDSQHVLVTLRRIESDLKGRLEARRQRASGPPPTDGLAEVWRDWRDLAARVAAYNEAVDACNRRITSHCERLAGTTVEAAELRVTQTRARLRRAEPEVVELARQLRELDEVREQVTAAKKAAADALDEAAAQRLTSFGERVDTVLERFDVPYRLTRFKADRRGRAKAGLSVALHDAEVKLATRSGDERFTTVLSDGDRTVLALAVFLASVEGDVSGTTLVWDDPMVGLDDHRAAILASLLTELAARGAQCLVLSHRTDFLDRLQGERLVLDEGGLHAPW